MKKIGITGGIGSGKSTVCKVFESIGYSVYYADTRAKYLMNHNATIVKSITELFGEEAYTKNGELNRAYIGSVVFQDREKLQMLNEIVHPETGRDFETWAETVSQTTDKSFLLKEAAILYESGAYKGVDAVISVYAPKQLRLERVMKRDASQADAVLARMDKQWPEQRKIQQADFVIYNDGKHLLIPQVLEVIQCMKKVEKV